MSGWELVILTAVALGTSTISGIAGMGGGVILLGVLLLFLPPLEAIPIHGAIQIASNSSRAFVLRRDIHRSAVGYHMLLLIPASILGLAAAAVIPVNTGRMMIGVFALVATWRPAWLTPRLEQPLSPRSFIGVGAVQGFINIPLGATGPLVAPFFRMSVTGREAFVASFAAAQTAGHLVKVGVFTADGFAWGDHLATIALASAAVVLGSILGTRLLSRVSERGFRIVFRSALTAISIRLIVRALL